MSGTVDTITRQTNGATVTIQWVTKQVLNAVKQKNFNETYVSFFCSLKWGCLILPEMLKTYPLGRHWTKIPKRTHG